MHFLPSFNDIQVDIAGIIAVLGEGSVDRIAHISALTSYHVIPRLFPAPQALLKAEVRSRRLPSGSGDVFRIGSGNYRQGLNHFTTLLHGSTLAQNEVQYVHVRHKNHGRKRKDQNAFRPQTGGPLLFCTLFGIAVVCILLATSAAYDDGFAIIAAVLLSLTSTLAGLSSSKKMRFEFRVNQTSENEQPLPESLLMIHYPEQSAFRVIKCSEPIAHLYFKNEDCRAVLNQSSYSFMVLATSLVLVGGLICLVNASSVMQIAFTVAYVGLNVMFRAAGALPTNVYWVHDFEVSIIDYEHTFGINPFSRLNEKGSRPSATNTPPTRTSTMMLEEGQLQSHLGQPPSQSQETSQSFTYTQALWSVIALTGTTDWVKQSNFAPKTRAWRLWLMEANNRARPRRNGDGNLVSRLTVNEDGIVQLPDWDYREALLCCLKASDEDGVRHDPSPRKLAFTTVVLEKVKKWARDARATCARKAAEKAIEQSQITIIND